MFKIYLDESGTHEGSPVISVGGYLAKPSQWQNFTSEWRRILKPTGIKIYHATDAQACQGEFRGWSKEDVGSLASQLLPVAPKHTLFGGAVVIALKDVRAALETRPDLKPYFRDEYGMCFQWCLHTILEYATAIDPTRPVAVIHEENDYFVSAMAVFKWMKTRHPIGRNLQTFSFGDKKSYTPLQAADALAFEGARRINFQSGPERRALSALAPETYPSRLRYVDKDGMDTFIGMLEAMKILHASGHYTPESWG